MGEERREITVRPAYHRCAAEPSKDYGCGHPRMHWLLVVGDDAITWEIFTDWGMPNEAFHDACPNCTHPRHKNGMPPGGATGGAVDWHLSFPPWSNATEQECCWSPRGRCYGDVGFGIGNELFDLLRVEGSDAVWAKMRDLLLTAHDRAPSGDVGDET